MNKVLEKAISVARTFSEDAQEELGRELLRLAEEKRIDARIGEAEASGEPISSGELKGRLDRRRDVLLARADALCEFPNRGRLYRDPYRMLAVDNGYRIFYRVDEATETVVIVHFFSPYRDIDALL